jgi:hypothetical protein
MKTVSLTMQDANGSPINITGRTYAAQVRATIDSSTVLASFSCSIANASAGQVNATLSATTTAALVPGDAIWSLRETSGSTVTTILEGPVQIVQSPTRMSADAIIVKVTDSAIVIRSTDTLVTAVGFSDRRPDRPGRRSW